MTREESLKLAQYEETPYYFQRLINKIYDDFENKYKQDEKDCVTCYHLGDNDYCEYCIRGEGYSKDYWELKV